MGHALVQRPAWQGFAGFEYRGPQSVLERGQRRRVAAVVRLRMGRETGRIQIVTTVHFLTFWHLFYQ